MKSIYIAILLIGACVLFAGCNNLPSPGGGTNILTSNTGTTNTITTSPTDAVPRESSVIVSVAEKDPIYNTLDVTFAGGNGQVLVKDIDVVFTGSDGTNMTKKLNPVKGEIVTFQGTKATDKVVAYANYFNGNRYKVIDQLVETRTREPAFTTK